MLRRGFRWSRFFLFLIISTLGAAGGWLWYSQQDEATRSKAEEHFLDFLDLARENRHTPVELKLILDFVADRIPLNIGLTIDPGQFAGDTTFIYGGLPESSEPLRVLANTGYLVGYDERRRNPAWVAYRAFEPPSWEAPERPERFVPDPRTRARVRPEDYTNSGFDRGHMAPNYAIAVMHGDAAQEETFLMSNIVPQSPELNRRVWRDLEARIIRRYSRRFETVWVITGPVYPQNNPTLLPSGVKIPEACYKILIDEHPQGLRALGFIIPQNVSGNEDPEQFLVSIREIEQRTGLNFLSALPEDVQDAIETWTPRRVW